MLSSNAILTLADLRRFLKVGQAAIAVSPAPGVGGATLTPSANGFSVGMPIAIIDGATESDVTVASVSLNAITWTPNLTAPPAAGAVVYDGSNDETLTDILNAVSAEFERVTGRYVIQRSGIVETRHGTGKNTMAVRRRPVASIASIVIDGAAVDAASYYVDADLGMVYLLNGLTFTTGTANVVITYAAGWSQADVPADIQAVIRRWSKFLYDEWTDAAVAAQSVSIGNQTFQINPDLPATLRRAVTQWIDQRVWG